MLHSFINALFVLVVLGAAASYAGEQVAPGSATKPMVQYTMPPMTLYLGADIAQTAFGWYRKTGNRYALHGSMGFSRIILDMDYGWGEIRRDYRPDESFSSTYGRYFRIGVSGNLLSYTCDHNQFFLGFCYASSSFNFHLEGRPFPCNHPAAKDPVQDSQVSNLCSFCKLPKRKYSDVGIAHWWELVAGTKVSLVHIGSIGCTVRYKFGKTLKHCFALHPFDVPGFGFGADKDAFGYSLYILVRIPLYKKVGCRNNSLVGA